VLANSLALLAYSTKDSHYRFWKVGLDFDALANWLIEEQSIYRHFEGAIVSAKLVPLFTNARYSGYLLRLQSSLQLPAATEEREWT